MPAASTFDTANAGAGGKRTGVRPKAVKWPDRNANTTRSMPMSDTPSTLPKPKKAVALSGTAAGNTALCTAGRSGNDLHYRSYDIQKSEKRRVGEKWVRTMKSRWWREPHTK